MTGPGGAGDVEDVETSGEVGALAKYLDEYLIAGAPGLGRSCSDKRGSRRFSEFYLDFFPQSASQQSVK